MRRPLVIANWKMNTNISDAVILATAVRDGVEKISNIEVVICPPVIWLTEFSQIIHKNIGHISLGAQNISHISGGSYTGEISASMVRDIAKYVIVGHSERRKHYLESNEIISRKTSIALDSGLTPVVCVGEEKKDEGSLSKLVTELQESLSGISKKERENIVIAYEPVWAVGADQPAEASHVVKVITALREVLSPLTAVIYGGDVNTSNVYNFVSRPEIDGVLVGRASLSSSDFVQICRIVSEYKK